MNWEKLKVKFPVVAIHQTESYRDENYTHFFGKQRVLITGKHTYESKLPEELVFSRTEGHFVFVGMKQGLAATVEPGYSNKGRKVSEASIKILDTYPRRHPDYFLDWEETNPKDPKLVSNVTEYPARVTSLGGGYDLVTLPDSAHFTQSGVSYALSEPVVAAYYSDKENDVYGVFEIDGKFQIKSLKVRKNTIAADRTMAEDVIGDMENAVMIHENRLVKITNKVEIAEVFPHTRLAHYKFSKFVGWTPGTPIISIVDNDFIPKQLELEKPVWQAWIEPDGLTTRILCDKNWICVLDLC